MSDAGFTNVYLVHGREESTFSRVSHELSAIWRYRGCLPNFVRNNLRRRYQRSVLGFVWSLLNPLLTMTIMTFVFSFFFHKEPRDFALYIFSGLLPWTFMSATMTSGCGSIVEAEAYLKKLNVPKILFPLVLVSTESMNFLLSLVALLCLGLAIGLPMNLAVLAIPLAVLPAICFTFGITLFLSVSTVYFRDIAHIVGVLLGGLFYLTPIIYPIVAIPERYQSWYQLNPFYHMLNLFRAIICENRLPNTGEWLSSWALAAVALAVGAVIYLWRERDIIYRL